MMIFASILQLIGGFVMSMGYFPQIRTSLKTKSVTDIDASYYPFIFSGLAMFQFYAITLVVKTGEGMMFLITNSVAVALAGTMLVLSTIYREKKVVKK